MLAIDLDEYLSHTGFKGDGGEGIGIAIIDTGCNFTGDNIVYQYNAYTGTKDVSDKKGHGSAIYEIINSVSPNSDYYIMKGLDDIGKGSMLGLYNCLIRCRDIKGIDIVCMSFSSFNRLSITTQKALDECIKEGKLILSSLGNDNGREKTYPSSIDGVYSVGGLNRELSDRFETSNYTPDTHFVALGENIFANGELRDGTSFANAIVVGQIADILSSQRIDKKEFNYEYISQCFKKSYRELNTAYGSIYKGEL